MEVKVSGTGTGTAGTGTAWRLKLPSFERVPEGHALVHWCCFGLAEDLNWNALDWDRAAEELTWERVGILLYSPVSLVCSV